MINRHLVIGHLGRDPETKIFENGSKVCDVTIATNSSYKDRSGEWQNETEWHKVRAWGYNADKLEKMKKGDLAYISGESKTHEYVKDDGKISYKYIKAEIIKNLNKKDKSDVINPNVDNNVPF